jgi:hypothetical protein
MRTDENGVGRNDCARATLASAASLATAVAERDRSTAPQAALLWESGLLFNTDAKMDLFEETRMCVYVQFVTTVSTAHSFPLVP